MICERVVSPWRCLKARHPCVYAYEEGDSTYFGCLHKVFAPELDLKALRDGSAGSMGRSDPYGPLRIVREPWPQCPVGIERAYISGAMVGPCVNPRFLREAFVV